MPTLILAGDLFSTQMQTIINTVNCKGVMGAGIALRCKRLYPEVYNDYVKRCAESRVEIGVPYLFTRPSRPWIINFPTKKHWRNPSKIDYIDAGLRYLLEHYQQWKITSLAIPALGCGNGGLLWADVGPLIYTYALQFDIAVEIYVPIGTPLEQYTESYLQKEPGIKYLMSLRQLELFNTQFGQSAQEQKSVKKAKRRKH